MLNEEDALCLTARLKIIIGGLAELLRELEEVTNEIVETISEHSKGASDGK